MHVFRGIQ